VTPQHGPSWDEDRAWSAFAPDPEPRHLAERSLLDRLLDYEAAHPRRISTVLALVALALSGLAMLLAR